MFYPAEYFRRMLGIFPIGDPTQYIPDGEVRSGQQNAQTHTLQTSTLIRTLTPTLALTLTLILNLITTVL